MSTLHISPGRLRIEKNTRRLQDRADRLSYLRERRVLTFSEAQRALISEAGGGGDKMTGRYEAPQDTGPKLVLAVGGSLVSVKSGLSGGGGPVGGDRGEVTGFSAGSRRRLMRTIASLDRQARPVFVTLTYPDVFPESPGKWKRDIDVFGKRLARKYPEGGFMWRMEFKERKSGELSGRVAPHFHLLVYGIPYRELRRFVPNSWYEVVGSGNKDHLSAGTRVELIYSFGGIMRYVGKYIAKEDEFPTNWTGRVWGIIGRDNLPYAPVIEIDLTRDEYYKLVRVGRRMCHIKGRALVWGVTWIMNSERLLDYLEYLTGSDPPLDGFYWWTKGMSELDKTSTGR